MVDVQTHILIQESISVVSAYASNPDNTMAWYVNIHSVEWQKTLSCSKKYWKREKTQNKITPASRFYQQSSIPRFVRYFTRAGMFGISRLLRALLRILFR